MTYQLTIKQKPAYLHAIVTGINSRENVMRYLDEVQRECIMRECYHILIEERLEGPRLGTIDVFQIAAGGSKQAQGIFKAIAYVDVNAAGELMKFAETVAVNRFLPVRIFSAVSEAEQWLTALNAQGNTEGQ